MQLRRSLQALLVSAVASTGIACGDIEVPIVLGLVGENTIGLTLPDLPPELGELSTDLTGGVETTMSIGIVDIFSFGGIPAGISVDHINIAGDPLLILGGLLDSGELCIYIDPNNPGGGTAVVKIFQGEADFLLALNTLVEVTNQDLVNQLGLAPLEFGSTIDESFPISLGELIGLLLGGGGGGGLELSQTITDTLDESIPIFGGAEISATLTLASVDTLPSTANTQFCDAFLAGP